MHPLEHIVVRGATKCIKSCTFLHSSRRIHHRSTTTRIPLGINTHARHGSTLPGPTQESLPSRTLRLEQALGLGSASPPSSSSLAPPSLRVLLVSEDLTSSLSVTSACLAPSDQTKWQSCLDTARSHSGIITIGYGPHVSTTTYGTVTTPALASSPLAVVKLVALPSPHVKELVRWSHVVAFVTDPIRRLNTHDARKLLSENTDVPLTLVLNRSELLEEAVEDVTREMREKLSELGWNYFRPAVHICSSSRASVAKWMEDEVEYSNSGVRSVWKDLVFDRSGLDERFDSIARIAHVRNEARHQRQAETQRLEGARAIVDGPFAEVMETARKEANTLKTDVLSTWLFEGLDRRMAELKRRVSTELSSWSLSRVIWRVDDLPRQITKSLKYDHDIECLASRAEGRLLQGAIALETHTRRSLLHVTTRLRHHLTDMDPVGEEVPKLRIREDEAVLLPMVEEMKLKARIEKEVGTGLGVRVRSAVMRLAGWQVGSATAMTACLTGLDVHPAGVTIVGGLALAGGFGWFAATWSKLKRSFFSRFDDVIIMAFKAEIQLRYSNYISETLSNPVNLMITDYQGNVSKALRKVQERRELLERCEAEAEGMLKELLAEDNAACPPADANLDKEEHRCIPTGLRGRAYDCK